MFFFKFKLYFLKISNYSEISVFFNNSSENNRRDPKLIKTEAIIFEHAILSHVYFETEKLKINTLHGIL